MYIDDLFIESLSNHSYVIVDETTRLAVIVDPARDVDQYLAALQRRGATLDAVLETHIHNDFLSGGPELVARTGGLLYSGAGDDLHIPHRVVRDGDSIVVGDLEVRVLATPGHTPEHIAYAVSQGSRGTADVFTGGSLLPGGVARTDLLGQEHAPDLAHQLHHSIHAKLLALPDESTVYPTHGGGSFCTVAPSSHVGYTTIGEERRGNHMLAIADPHVFADAALRGLPPFPTYFRRMRLLNQAGARPLGKVTLPPASTVGEAQQKIAKGAGVVDLRPAREFARVHIPGAVSIPGGSGFASWVGWVFPLEQPLVLVLAPDADLYELTRALRRIGFESVEGFLNGGMDAWQQAGYATASLPTISTAELHESWERHSSMTILDVRFPAEWDAGHIPGAAFGPVSALAEDGAPNLSGPVVTVCGEGPRATLAASLLLRSGVRDVATVIGGMEQWKELGYPMDSGS